MVSSSSSVSASALSTSNSSDDSVAEVNANADDENVALRVDEIGIGTDETNDSPQEQGEYSAIVRFCQRRESHGWISLGIGATVGTVVGVSVPFAVVGQALLGGISGAVATGATLLVESRIRVAVLNAIAYCQRPV